MCGPLCDAVLRSPPASGQKTLEYLEHANLFTVSLDNKRYWYRYHHLFADLLRQRLHQSITSSEGDEKKKVAKLHKRASQWFEDNHLEIEAFHHATLANDVERAARLIENEGLPLHFRGAEVAVLKWLESLPATVLDAIPSLWVTYASAILTMGHVVGVEQKAQAAEVALRNVAQDAKTRDLIGRIASIRATLAVTQHQADTIITQSRLALEYLLPDNLPERAAITWKLGYAYQLRGDRAAAGRAHAEALSSCEAVGRTVIAMMAAIGLGHIQEGENQLPLAAETLQRALQLAGDPASPPVCDAHLGLARIHFQWNNLDAAKYHAQQSILLARQIETTDREILCEIFMARLKLVRGDVSGAAAILAQADQVARQCNYVNRIPEIVAMEVLTLLRRGNVTAASQLVKTQELPISNARVLIAQGDPAAALVELVPWRQKMEARSWADERLKVMVLQAVALYCQGKKIQAMQLLRETLAIAQPGGFIRIFLDEGTMMAQLLAEAAAQGMMPDYTRKLLAAFEDEEQKNPDRQSLSPAQTLIEPLSQRELKILQLVSQGLSNREISQRLFLALSTVKGHNRNIFDKLQVQSRTEAIARCRELGLL
jgi:LuxR family maltose regulon positive regulatory protein